jgi:hypothetical protein
MNPLFQNIIPSLDPSQLLSLNLHKWFLDKLMLEINRNYFIRDVCISNTVPNFDEFFLSVIKNQGKYYSVYCSMKLNSFIMKDDNNLTRDNFKYNGEYLFETMEDSISSRKLLGFKAELKKDADIIRKISYPDGEYSDEVNFLLQIYDPLK